MFVAINISRIAIEFAVVGDDANIVSNFSISTQNKKTDDQYITEIKNVFDYLNIDKDKITHAAILSNVHKFDKIVDNFFNTYIKLEPIVIENKDVPFKCRDDINISEIPIDIFAGCYACNKRYGDNIIFVDFDTIVTFSLCVNNEFIGYSVFPGFDLLSSSVHEQIPEYPEILIEPTQQVTAIKRYDALNVGFFHGIMGACDNIINNIKESYRNKKITVIATCKKPELLRYSGTINIIDQNLRINSIIECARTRILGI